MKELTELYQNNQIEEFLQELENIASPKEAMQTWLNWANDQFGDNESKWDMFFEKFSEGQLSRLNNFGSTQAQKTYLLKEAESRTLTDEEFADLRACDF